MGMLLLATGMVFGVIGGLQYVIQGFLKPFLSFEKIRPLHVSSMVFWIILASVGSVTSFLPQHTGRKLYSGLLLKIQFIVFFISVCLILGSYVFGIFGGREYWEFNPWFALPIIAGWILFLINIMASIGSIKNQPVYVWMWLTGTVFFLFTYLESYLWIFPYFRNNVVNDMTIQWKSYGSMVGSWNMLIYGCSIFLMTKISGNKDMSHSKTAFALYFTGLFNLMFNWGHHIYTLPTYDFIKHISYIVSMTELLILARIIWLWKSSVSDARRNLHIASYRFVIAADAWVFLTLILAIIMSIPAINVYTHGTHITIAHSMGATIGINSFLLLAMFIDIHQDTFHGFRTSGNWFNRGFVIANISLFIFWISLIMAGLYKAQWQMSDARTPFNVMMYQLRPFFIVFVVSGSLFMVGMWMIIYPMITSLWTAMWSREIKKNDISPSGSSVRVFID